MGAMDASDADKIVGQVDGFRQGYVEGWAWRPLRPHEPVIVQMLVNGNLIAESTACIPRPDLQTAGIGNGNHAFALPLAVEPDGPPALRVIVRTKDGAVLPAGEFEITTSDDERADLARRRSVEYLEQVFGPFTATTPQPPRATMPAAVPRLHFILYSATAASAVSTAAGMPEYSYYFVMRGFLAVLRRMGVVHIVKEPAREVNEIADRCATRGEACLFFSFAPPQSTQLGLRCPTIPVIAWEFGTIPTGGWNSNPREDWRLVLRQCGRAITISDFAARAVRAGMGADFPVAFVPTPVWDRHAAFRERQSGPSAIPPGGPVTLHVQGLIWDSRAVRLSMSTGVPPLPQSPPRAVAARASTRGALLSLAIASEAAQDIAHAEQVDAERAASERAEAERVEAERVDAMRVEAERAQADQAEAERVAALVTVSPRRTLRQRLRITARLARQWYREAVADALPAPIKRLVSASARAAIRLCQPALRQQPPPPTEPRPQTPPPVNVEPPTAAETAVRADDVAPATTEPAQATTNFDSPADALPLPEPIVPFTKYLPAPDSDPLPEPALASFMPPMYQDNEPSAPSGLTLDGIIFTSVLSPKDGRKNWQDILTAFATAFRDAPQATLVLKMIGNDPAYWWWEFNLIVKRLPAFACRVVVIACYLDEQTYEKLIGATHFVVNASLAEGQCLPLVEFMSAHRPAIAPRHTAMLDYVTADNTLIVESSLEFCAWPHDPRNHLNTTRYRIEWSSLRNAFEHAMRIVTNEPARYETMANAAATSVRNYCADDVAGPRLAAFLGLGDEVVQRAGWVPNWRPAAEKLLEYGEQPPLNNAPPAAQTHLGTSLHAVVAAA
jgi:hypothetical protein